MSSIRTRIGALAIIASMAVTISSSGSPPGCVGAWEPLGAGLSSRALAITGHDDGTGPAVYAAGLFLEAGAAPVRRIARWDGTRWTALDRGVNGPVLSILSVDFGHGPTLLAGGEFSMLIGGPPISSIAGWNGTQWSPIDAGLSGCTYPWDGICSGTTAVKAMITFDADGAGPAPASVYAAGDFRFAGGIQVQNVAAWNGSAWSSVGGGTGAVVESLAVFDDGSGSGPALYAGGDFLEAGGVLASRIAKWTGNAWIPLGSGIGVGSGSFRPVMSMAVFDDGSGPALYVGGQFTTAGGLPVRNIARWNGVAWSSVGSGVSGRVNAMTVFDDGAGPALFMAGDLRSAGDMSVDHIARWDGTNWTAPPGMDRQINALAVFDDGAGPALYAAGEFRSAGGQPANRIARLTCGLRGDLDSDGRVDIGDLRLLFSNWSIPPAAQGCAGATPCPADLNCDGLVGPADLQVLLSHWMP